MAPTSEALAARRREQRAIAIGSMVLWVFVAGLYALWIKFLHAISGPMRCAVPGMDSTYGEASWGWFPPGTSCSFEGYPGVADTEPGWFVPAGLVGWLVATLALLAVAELWFLRQQRSRAGIDGSSSRSGGRGGTPS